MVNPPDAVRASFARKAAEVMLVLMCLDDTHITITLYSFAGGMLLWVS